MSDTIADTQARLTAFIAGAFPNADIAPGTVLSELVVKMAATIQNPIMNDIASLNQANSVITALDSATPTFSPIIDNIASNYSVVRSQGLTSAGNVKVVVNTSNNLYIDAGFSLTQPVLNLKFVTPAGYRVSTSPTSPNDITLHQIGSSSQYYFILPVQAVAPGSQYKIPDQTALTLTPGSSLFGFVTANAIGNFTDGAPIEDDKALISRFRSGMTHKTLLSRDSIFYRVKELYPTLRDVSIITSNDAEMTRSKQNIFGISTLGFVDVYINSSFGLSTTTLKLLGTKTDTATWEISFGVNDAAGFYKIISILPSNTQTIGSLSFTSNFDYKTSGYSQVNLVNNKYEARFTKYQTADVVVTYDETTITNPSGPVPVGSQQYFDILVSHQPNIKDIQDFILSNDNRIACADYLVKAALPCFVTVNLKLIRKDPFIDFPVDLLKQDIFNYINGLSFGESIQASTIIKLCHEYAIKGVQLPITLTGDIFSDHSTVTRITSNLQYLPSYHWA
jgi:hypothetical protein